MLACTPHPGLGTVVYRHQSVDLATCKTGIAVVLRRRDDVTVRATKDSQSIVFKGKVVLKIHENHKGFPQGSPGPILLEGVSPDGKWILYAIDPMGSASLAADGLTLRAVSTSTGHSRVIASGLLYDDYRAWCGGKLVLTAGGDRYAAHHKWLIVAQPQPPPWLVRRVAIAPAFAFGSMACQGNGIIVQATRDRLTTNPTWSLWAFGLEGGMYIVDTAPKGWSDDSPHVGRDGTVYFVRSHNGNGALYAIRHRKLVGPLLSLGHEDGYYGHRVWPYTVTR